MDPAEWLLTKSERGNAQTVLDARHFGEKAWSSGNFVRPLVHGATYFSELAQRIRETEPATQSTSPIGAATPTSA